MPVERQYWDVDPFAGEILDGAIWGRGTLDMKGMGVIELMTLMLLKRQGVALRRGVTFLAAADEEAGSAFGVGWLADHRPEWLQSDLVINEGAYGLTGVGDAPIFHISPTEKVPLWVELRARGRPGHGSVPHADNCADRMVRALGRVAGWEQPLQMTPVMRAHLDGLVQAGLLNARDSHDVQALARKTPSLRARLGNTVALTTVTTGIKVNVIPAEATATLDCRLMPNQDVDAFLSGLRAVIADEKVTLSVLHRSSGAESSMEHEFVAAVDDVVRERAEGAHIIPELSSGFTDSRIYRQRGVPAFGFVPCLVAPADLAGIHGHNERISIGNLRLGVQVLYAIVLRLCAA